ncbi:ATP-binding cassette transporter snq2 [Emydomyces testavorans]|uniref:ATP-binding cassette transporter snq2 n=1 Tax=Emydomyces testavorans TaxID=2070801 RepID=A0AAF0DE36_9EURO|nr:ATP-binding cassette transporter snq2 [Emydomyces testavorans]
MDGASDKIGGLQSTHAAVNPIGTNADSAGASANVDLNNDDAGHEELFLPLRSESYNGSRLSTESRPESPDSPSSLNGCEREYAKQGNEDGGISERIPSQRLPLSEWTSANTAASTEWANLQTIVSNMFGRARQEVSEEEKTRHVGVIWKNLTVQGVGFGATLQRTNSDTLLALPRLFWRLLTGKVRKKRPIRTLLDDFTGCVKPGEMLLVLGQPGSGCSTFLKALGNQRAGYESVEGEVTYGGTDAKTMAENYRSEVLYNPEDDLHYATLTVKQTLNFAIKTRTPGKESRKPGESRQQYRDTFLKSVAKLFWIEHCLDTRVGDAIVRGVSGGEKKRVSIAEALITKASTQCWDNSTRGLDASTALEYVQSLRTLTTMTHVSTLVAIYQASESLYKLFDRVILLTEGKCAYFGPTSDAKAYFESLGFECPTRWTTADFLTSVTEPHARRIRKGWEDRIPRSAEQFKQAYNSSTVRKATIESIEEFQAEIEANRDELDDIAQRAPKKNFTIPYYRQVLALSGRQFQVMIGDRQSLFGYLIPPGQMRPWLKWLIWINPVQYTFESLMANEFYNMRIACVPPTLVPEGPSASPQFQSCALQGSQPGQAYVAGSDYILSNYGYTRAHLWRNFGIIIAILVFFIALTMFGTELQSSSRSSAHGGAAVTVFMRGQVPASVKHEMRGFQKGHDEEEGRQNMISNGSETDGMDEKEVQGIAKHAAVLTWQNVNYTIPYKGMRKPLLQDVQGYVKPGRLTALMGASGAGKTTLLNVLAQRTDFGVVTGSFLIDGKPLPKNFQRATGFAEQADIHEPTSTVRESLRFSALLRRPKDIPIQEKYDYCERILELLELQYIAGATIGHMGVGLNQEQRKRVTIAVELASKPDLLLFLDEPTSGLDSLAAFNIIRFLRKLANMGQAILCTIHQPSAVLFEEFDDLLLLQAGGRVVFHGELGVDSRRLIKYFTRNGARPCPPDANPAEYMLDVIGAGNPDYKGPDWADVWANSPEHQLVTDEIKLIVDSQVGKERIVDPSGEREFAMPQWTQTIATAKRAFVAYWRTPEYTTCLCCDEETNVWAG